MANKKISELTSASTLTGTEEFAVVQSAETKKSTLTVLQHYIVNTLEPTNLTVVSGGGDIDLGDSTYNNAEIIVLSWSGASDTIELTLPDATTSTNTNRAFRIITDSTYTTNTKADLTPKAGQTLDGSSDAYRINKAYEGIKVFSNGVEWFIIQKKAS